MSEKEIKIYHVETQEDYDDLMIKLENEGCMWSSGGCMWPSGDKPTDLNFWYEFEAETVIYLGSWRKGEMTRGDLSEAKRKYSTIPIVKHKAKGAKQMEKVVVPQFVAEYIENHYGTKPDVWDKADLIRDFDMYLECNGNLSLQKWVKNDDNFLTLITAIITNDYEVEEEKKYYWRKKKEHILEFETTVESTHLTYSHITGHLFFSDSLQSEGYQTKFTETEVKQLVSEKDFNKLEKVEITE